VRQKCRHGISTQEHCDDCFDLRVKEMAGIKRNTAVPVGNGGGSAHSDGSHRHLYSPHALKRLEMYERGEIEIA
jgi:hypothetical protein